MSARPNLVEELRSAARTPFVKSYWYDLIMLEAAEEIEGLRVGWLSQASLDSAEIARLEVEIERLREALREIAAVETVGDGAYMVDVARDALSRPEDRT